MASIQSRKIGPVTVLFLKLALIINLIACGHYIATEIL